jgi:hypothetical protein
MKCAAALALAVLALGDASRIPRHHLKQPIYSEDHAEGSVLLGTVHSGEVRSPILQKYAKDPWARIVAAASLRNSTVAVVVLLLCLALAHEASVSIYQRLPLPPSNPRFVLQLVYLIWTVVVAIDYSVFIPTAYAVGHNMGCAPITGGVFIGCAWVMLPVAAWLASSWYRTYSQKFGRHTAVLSTLLFVGQDLCIAMVLDSGWALGPETMWFLIALRFACGLGYLSYIVRYMTYGITSTEGRVGLSILGAAATNLGLCLGPLWSALVLTVARHDGVALSPYGEAAMPLYGVAIAWAVIVLAFCFAIPLDRSTPGMTTPRQATPSTPHQATPKSEMTHADRKIIVIMSLLFSAERGLTVSAIEAGTAMLLELQFAWGARDIGLGIGTVFAITTISALGVAVALHRAPSREVPVLLILAVTAAFTTTLLFDFGKFGATQILLADGIIYSCVYTASGIIDGLATRAAIAGTWYSMENYLALKVSVASGARALGAPMARGLIDIGGRNTYAFVMVSMGLCGLTSAMKLALLIGRQRHTEESS